MLKILTPSPEPGPNKQVFQFERSHRLTRVNLSQVLAQYLMESSILDRPRTVQEFTLEGVGGYLLDHIEILFDPQLQVHPLRWLEQRAKDGDIYVVWPGDVDEQHLSYAAPGHPEHQRFDLASHPTVNTQCI